MKSLFLFLFYFFSAFANAQNIALNFGGDDDWVTGTNTSLPQGNSPRTIEAWIKYSTSKNDMSIFNYGTFSYNQKFTLHLYNGVYIIGEGNDLSTGYNFNDGNWHHLAVTHDGTTTIVYVDGVIRGSRNTTYNTTGYDFQLGVSFRNGNWDFRFEGTIDEVRVWNVARTQQQIIDNMFVGISTSTGLIASYHLNDGIPNANNSSVTTVQDESGTSSHGTLNNFTLNGTSSNFVDNAMVTLPVELLSFSASEMNCTALLQWQTATESNMKYFIIEESKNGIDYVNAKQIKPNNRTETSKYYAYLPVNSRKIFYRLKMQDNDGKVTYSETVMIKSICESKLSVWPSSATNQLSLRSEAIGQEYFIYTASGSLVKKGIIKEHFQTLDISTVTQGIYYISVAGHSSVSFRKE